jgi:2-dehydro-3-deoxygluconokinase
MAQLNIRQDDCELDFLSLGSLVHRLDPGRIPFIKARSVDIHVSGGEYNVAANLADCFGLKTGIATAMVNYGIGELVQSRVQEMGVKPFYKWFEHDGARGPNIARSIRILAMALGRLLYSITAPMRQEPC